jgi:hypothetical protein
VGLYQITVKFKITAKVGSVSYKCFRNITFASLTGNDLGRGLGDTESKFKNFQKNSTWCFAHVLSGLFES